MTFSSVRADTTIVLDTPVTGGSDPRTWTDFSNPEARGFEKVDCHTPLERALMGGAAGLGIAATIVLSTLFVEATGPWLSREGIAIAVPALALGAGVLLCLRWLTNNFYLIDRARQSVYYHTQFLSFRRVRLLLERKDIHAMAVETRRQDSRTQRWWEHRTVLVDVGGRIVPLGNWERDGLEGANTLARELAGKFGCSWYESPEESRLVVKRDYGHLTIAFDPQPPLEWAGTVPLIIIMFVMILGLALLWWLSAFRR